MTEQPNAVSPDGWSGYGGAAIREVQVASGSVAALPSSAAPRIAVIGRQKLYRALSRQVTISASAAFVYARANSRAWSARVPPCVVATERRMFAIVAVALPWPQKFAASVCACDLVEFVARPIAFTSS